MIIVILALIAQTSALHNISNCTDEFHMILNKAVEIKNHCNIKGFYDCCQVINVMSIAALFMLIDTMHVHLSKNIHIPLI